jgi:hypothetical protein
MPIARLVGAIFTLIKLERMVVFKTRPYETPPIGPYEICASGRIQS